MLYDDLLTTSPFALDAAQKEDRFKAALKEAFDHHFSFCAPYRRLCERRGFTPAKTGFDLEEFPYLPVDVFKTMRLSSAADDQVIRTLQSSATTSQTPSTVVLDQITRLRQMKTLMWLLSDGLGKQRRPFIILDVPPESQAARSDTTISARTAAIRGFLTAASSAVYCMTMDSGGRLKVDLEGLRAELEKAQEHGQRPVIFGYTYVFYIFVAQELKKRGAQFTLKDATLMHIGGWKKLQTQAVSKATFNEAMTEVFGVGASEIKDTYGFTEQLGIVYMDGVDGLKRCSAVSEIIIRDPQTLRPVPDGKEGLVEFITPLPHSYPGIALLLEDIGRIITREPSRCGRFGTGFQILGRAKQAEIRGCGDIVSERVIGA